MWHVEKMVARITAAIVGANGVVTHLITVVSSQCTFINI